MKKSIGAIAAVMLLGGLAPGADPRRTDQDAVLKKLRAECVTVLELRGARVQGSEVRDGRLELSGTLDRAEQAEPLAEAARRIIESDPAWQERFPNGASAQGMNRFPIRSEYLPRLRRDFAAQPPGLLARTRLEDAYYDPNGLLHVVGLCIDQSAHIATRPGAVRNDAESPNETLTLAVRDRLKGYLTVAQRVPENLRLMLDVRRFAENPARALQRLANQAARFDGVFCRDAWYDADGTLQIVGQLDGPESRADVAGLLRRPEFKEYGPLSLDDPVDPERSLGGLTASSWNASLLKALQARLAADNSLKHCRLTRARFIYPAQGDLRLHFEGIGFLRGEPETTERLTTFLRDECRKVLKATGSVPYGIEETLEQVPNPRLELQTRVSADPALDGVRIDDVAFGPDGAIALLGLRVNAAQPLTARLAPALRALVPRLGDVGTAWDLAGMADLPTDQLLRDLRAWSASKGDAEVCLERAYFVHEGNAGSHVVLRIQGFCNAHHRAEVVAQLSHWAEGHAVVKRLEKAHNPGGDPHGWALALTPKTVSLVTALRKLVPRDPALDGVRIDRGYYDEQGVFVLSGLQDHAGQAEPLVPLLQKAAEDGGWLDQLPEGARTGAFAVFALRPMLDRLAQVMPAYPVFDGVTIDRAYYNEKSALVLAGRVVGREAPPNLSRPLKQALGAAPGLEVVSVLDPQPRDPDLSPRAVTRALDLIEGGNARAAVELLDAAILNDPRETAAWYLRAGCSLNQGNVALAERDMRRMKDLEHRAPSLTRIRYQKLTRLQGAFRIAVNELETRVGTGQTP